MSVSIRVQEIKPGRDGHGPGAKVSARARARCEHRSDLHRTPEMIVNEALQEDVRMIGLSVLSGAHNAIVDSTAEPLCAKEMNSVPVGEVIQPQTSPEETIRFSRDTVKQAA